MATKLTQAARVGLFVLLSGAASYGIYRTIGTTVVSARKNYVVHAFIKDATGLASQSRVTIAGIPVGTIESIKLEGGRARIDVRVSGDVPLYENATLGKKATSLLGEAVIVLTAGTEDRKRIGNGDEIRTIVEQATTDQVIDEVKEIAARIKVVADQLAKSIGTEKGGEDIRATLHNLAEATDALNKTIRENRESLNVTLKSVAAITSKAEPRIERILDNVRQVSEDVRQVTAASGPKGKPGDLRQTLERLNTSSKSLESALANVDSVTGRINRGEGTLGKLTKDETLINEVQGAAEGVNELVGGIQRVQTVVGLRSDYNFLSNTVKSYVELRLQPREDKYYVVELINDPRGKTSFTQTDVDTTDPRAPGHYRTIETKTTDAFRFTLQFARRLGPLTGRFGIKESTGGLGLDLHLLNNRFELVQDVFGFGEEIQPRYRAYLSYEFLKRLWLMGGVDHVFSSNRRDYFLGLQLRFIDDDLKSILPFMPSGIK